jgi:HlyD family secretion protein
MPAMVKVAALPNISLQGALAKIALQSEAAATPDSSAAGSASSAGGDSSSSATPFAVGFKIEVHNLKPLTNINLRSGYSATADIIVKQAKNALLIPARVLQFDNDKPYVMVLDKSNKQQKRFIKIGLSDGVQVQVLSGVSKDEKIIEVTTTSDNDNN